MTDQEKETIIEMEPINVDGEEKFVPKLKDFVIRIDTIHAGVVERVVSTIDARSFIEKLSGSPAIVLEEEAGFVAIPISGVRFITAKPKL